MAQKARRQEAFLIQLALIAASAACQRTPEAQPPTPELSAPPPSPPSMKSLQAAATAYTNEMQAARLQSEAEDMGIASLDAKTAELQRSLTLEPMTAGERKERRKQLRQMTRQLSQMRRSMSAPEKSVTLPSRTVNLLSETPAGGAPIEASSADPAHGAETPAANP